MPLAVNPKTGEARFLDQDGQWKPARTAVNPETQEALAFDGAEWKALPASKGVLNYIDDAVRSLASGATLGFADEFSALMTSLTSDKTYEQALKEERAKDKKIPTALRVTGEIAGGVGGAIAAAPAAAAGAAATGLSRLPGLAKSIGAGVGLGAAAGAGSTEGSRLEGAATGAAIGGAVGAAAPAVVKGVTGIARGIRNAVSPQAGAAADLGRAIVRDEDTAAGVVSRLRGAQAERPGTATLADVGGENVKGLVERVAQTPGAGRTQVVPALTQRQQAQAGRISEDLKALTGTNKTAIQTIEETMEARATEAAPLYKEAMDFDANQQPEIVNAFLRAVKTGWGQAVAKSNSFRRTLQTEYGLSGDVRNMPIMPLIDAWKKEVDGLIGEAFRRGNNNQARVLSKMRDDVIGVVDEFNPAYRTARAAWEGKSKYLDSVEEGRSILGKNVSAEELAGKFAALGEAEKEAYRIGAVSSIINRMGSDPAKLGDMTKYLRSPEMTKKIAAMMPTPEAAASWLKRLEFEVSSSELTARALGNSATARRLAEREDAHGIVGDLVMDAIMSGGSGLSLFNRMMNYGPRWLRDTLRSRTDKALADILMNPARAQDIPGIVGRAAQQQAGSAGTLAPAAATAGAVNALQ
jgi:hypothetical protein